MQRTKKPEKQCRKHFFDGKEKMNPPTEEIAVLMEAEPGEKGKYLLMAGIAVLGIGLLFVLPPLGVAVLFASMVGNGLMHEGRPKSWRVH